MPLGSSLSKLMLPWKFGYNARISWMSSVQVLARRELQETSGGCVVPAGFVFQKAYE